MFVNVNVNVKVVDLDYRLQGSQSGRIRALGSEVRKGTTAELVIKRIH